jgi:uncharacterized protein (TIGR02145 family)
MRIQFTRKGKRFFATTLAATLALALAFTFNACEAASGKSALVGRWTGGFEFLSDGTGIIYGSTFTWKVEKDRLYLIESGMASSYGYKISGSTLTLIDGEGKEAKLNKTERCGNEWYDIVTQSCKGNEIVDDRCNGKAYNLKTEYCLHNLHNGTIKKIPTPTINYGSVTHGGQSYKTVKIGEQTWMAENLNYNAEGSKCNENKPADCEKYGRLYNWETAKKACPSGWHLPSNAEWDKLFRFADGTNGTDSPYKSEIAGKFLKSKEGWDKNWDEDGNGIDIFGFSALPGGNDGNVGNSGWFWSASESSNDYDDYAYYWYMGDNSNGVSGDIVDKRVRRSVRCVKD